MRRKHIRLATTTAVAILLILSVLIPRIAEGKTYIRYEQHKEEMDRAEADTNTAIDEEHFSTHLPIVNIDTGNRTIPGRPQNTKALDIANDIMIEGRMQVIDAGEGLNTLKTAPSVDSKIMIRVRGNSSRRFDKAGYLVHFINDKGEKADHDVLGMGKDSTWVLNGPFLDKTLMRNYMFYNISGMLMDYSPDVRYCEAFLNHKYIGVYLILEKNSMSKDRINLEKYKRGPVSSYIVRYDRLSSGQVNYADSILNVTGRAENWGEIIYPGKMKITDDLTEYITGDISAFEKSLYSYDYDSRREGYTAWIDVDNFAQFMIINEVSQNVDAGLYSTTLYKDVHGKMKLAVWDFNNAVDNYMEEQTAMEGFDMISKRWFEMLVKDRYFTDTVIRLYAEDRRGVLSDDNIRRCIREVHTYLGTAIERNEKVWGYTYQPENDLLQDDRKIGSYKDAIYQFENRLIARMHWMDEHIDVLSSYSADSATRMYNP